MKLKKVQLRNFCQHKDVTVEFSLGLNAILGANGSGKSNFVNGIYAGLTNDFSRFVGAKADQVNQLATENDKSFIDLWFDHNDNEVYVRRGLRPATKYMAVNDEPKITNEKDIATKLEGILGVPAKTIADYVFVDQWQLFSFLLKSPGERAKALQRLFGIDKAELCWKATGEFISRLTMPVSIIDVDAAKKRIADNTQKRGELMTTRDKWAADMAVIAKLLPMHEKTIEKAAEYQRLVLEIPKLEAEFKVLTRSLAVADAAEGAAWNASDAAYDVLEDERPKLEEAKRLLANVDANNKVVAERAKLEKRLKDLREPVEVTMPAECRGDYYTTYDMQNLMHEKTSLLAEVREKEKFIREVNEILENNHSSCPTCGQQVTKNYLLKKVTEFKHEIEEVKPLIQRLQLYYEYIHNVDKYFVANERYFVDKKNIEESLANLPPYEKLDVDKADLVRQVTYLNDLELDKEITEELHSESKAKLATAKALHSNCKNRISEANAKLKALEPANLACLEAKNDIALYRKLQLDLAEFKAHIVATDQSITDDEARLAEAVEIKKRAGSVTAFSKRLNSVRDLLHRDALPKIVANRYLSALTSGINDVLESFDSPFWVTPTNDLCFRAKFHDGRDVPAEALSGGQKAIFAIAFRIVVNSTFASDLGLLCLDEPTAGLDDKNIDCLTIAFDRLKELSKSTGLQCLLITHEKALMSHFDKVIEF